MALLCVSHLPATLVGMGISYIPGHPKFWTPLQIPPLGDPGASQPTLCLWVHFSGTESEMKQEL